MLAGKRRCNHKLQDLIERLLRCAALHGFPIILAPSFLQRILHTRHWSGMWGCARRQNECTHGCWTVRRYTVYTSLPSSRESSWEVLKWQEHIPHRWGRGQPHRVSKLLQPRKTLCPAFLRGWQITKTLRPVDAKYCVTLQKEYQLCRLPPPPPTVSWERTAGSSAASCWPSTAAVKCGCHG